MAGRLKLGVVLASRRRKTNKRRAGQAEEDEVDRDDVAQDLAVGARQRDHRRDDALQDDRDDRHAAFVALTAATARKNRPSSAIAK